jgi:D-glycero-alpha-D-manno-heptose-7-phosphate kinase
VNEGKKILDSGNVDDFGRLLNTSWVEKKSLSKLITNNKIDELYNEAIRYGALGGKLLGAGGGGFLLMYMKNKNAKNFFKRYKNIINVPFNFTKDGSQVILNNL